MLQRAMYKGEDRQDRQLDDARPEIDLIRATD